MECPSSPNSPQIFTAPPIRRGPMYSAYAELRELRLRRKLLNLEDEIQVTPPPKKMAVPPTVCQSVPNLSAALRKENRRPAVVSHLPPKNVMMMKTPPPPRPAANSLLRRSGSMSSGKGADRFRVDSRARKSYSCLKELKGFGVVDTPEENGRRISSGGMGKKIGGSKRYG